MKRFGVLVLAVVTVMVFTGVAFAQKTNTGCGLGYMIFKGKDGLVSQTCAVTTNGTFGNQTFGITSGTSECDQYKKFYTSERLNIFVADNMDNLAKDIAMGRGETLDAFADLMQVPSEKRPEFYQKLQSSFASIFTSENVVLANVVDNVAAVSSSN